METEKLVLTLELEPGPLPSRRCSRCKGTDFRALKFEPLSYPPGCADPREAFHAMLVVLSHVEEDRAHALEDVPANLHQVRRALAMAKSAWEGTTSEGQTSVPLAVCLGCRRLVALI